MFSTSVWTHVAVERLNTSIFVYTAGVCRITQTVAGGYSLYNNASPWLIGGASYNDATKRCFPGYIDDARLTFVSKYGGTNYTP